MTISIDRSTILGWGADLDRSCRPAVPMERMPPRLDHLPVGPITQQLQQVEVLHSNERPGITPVFGSTLPPRGLSGWMRRRAFRRSENDVRHWMMLLAADRVNVIEGLFQDVRKSRATHAIAVVGVVGLALVWMSRRR
ncbi:MAG TPA: hypothetical protein VD865_07815 [Stenotrophomonas sp.]|nr:hypothetical protein [Stenotrophomonas sp.]